MLVGAKAFDAAVNHLQGMRACGGEQGADARHKGVLFSELQAHGERVAQEEDAPLIWTAPGEIVAALARLIDAQNKSAALGVYLFLARFSARHPARAPFLAHDAHFGCLLFLWCRSLRADQAQGDFAERHRDQEAKAHQSQALEEGFHANLCGWSLTIAEIYSVWLGQAPVVSLRRFAL